MKISQKLVSLRCRVLVKNKRLVVFWLLIKMHVLIAGVKAEECTYFFCMSVSSDTVSHMHPFFPCRTEAGQLFLVPAEVDLTWAISTFLYQWLMELTSCTGVDICPTKLTVILQLIVASADLQSILPGTKHCLTCFYLHHLILTTLGSSQIWYWIQFCSGKSSSVRGWLAQLKVSRWLLLRCLSTRLFYLDNSNRSTSRYVVLTSKITSS